MPPSSWSARHRRLASALAHSKGIPNPGAPSLLNRQLNIHPPRRVDRLVVDIHNRGVDEDRLLAEIELERSMLRKIEMCKPFPKRRFQIDIGFFHGAGGPSVSLSSPPLMDMSEAVEPWTTSLHSAKQVLASHPFARLRCIEDAEGRAMRQEDIDIRVGGDGG